MVVLSMLSSRVKKTPIEKSVGVFFQVLSALFLFAKICPAIANMFKL